VPSRVNSPADVEIGSATRDANLRTLTFTPSVLNGNFFVQNTVVNRIQTKTGGDGSITGEEVEITIQFTTPIILPAGDYFFRPEVLLAADSAFDFLYLSAPRPIVSGDTVRDGPASLDPQLELGAGLAANRHRHYRWRHTADVQYDFFSNR
jgi:hypothetical protein